MILPFGELDENQHLWLVRKINGRMHVEQLGGVRFVPMVSPLFDNPEEWAEI